MQQTRVIGQAFVLAATALSACVPPAPPQLEPKRLAIAKAPTEVVQIAARVFATNAFEVVVSDATAGIITAKRVRTPKDHVGAIRCRYAPESIGDRMSEAHLTIAVTAAKASAGSDVQINANVVSKSGSSPFKHADSSTDCASRGIIEQLLVDALTAP